MELRRSLIRVGLLCAAELNATRATRLTFCEGEREGGRGRGGGREVQLTLTDQFEVCYNTYCT